MTSTEIRDRRRTLRYRGLLVKQMVQMKNRVSGLLMEAGVTYNRQWRHKVGYFAELMSGNKEIDRRLFTRHKAEIRKLSDPSVK
jgi:transposase